MRRGSAHATLNDALREFVGADHGFTHAKPIEVAREAIELIGEHLRREYA